MTWNRYPDRFPNPKWADNWEDDPQRLAYQAWLAERSRTKSQRCPSAHRGDIGLGAMFRKIIEETQ